MRASELGGFTILEVLVAVLVLALGVMGATAMQLHAQRARQQAGLQSQATQLANGLAERMRANAVGLAAADSPYLTLDYDAHVEPSAPARLCYGADCGPLALAEFDLYELKLQLRERLPGGRVLVCRDSAVVSGKVLRWACDGSAPLVIKLGWRGVLPDGAPDLDDDGGARPAVAVALGVAP